MMFRSIFVVVALLVMTGCANSGAGYTPIVDGVRTAQFDTDLQQCQTLAKSKAFWNGDVKSDAAAGAVLGAVIGAIDDGGDGAIGGAVVGAALGGGERAWEVRDERKGIVIQCMNNRGHNVVG